MVDVAFIPVYGKVEDMMASDQSLSVYTGERRLGALPCLGSLVVSMFIEGCLAAQVSLFVSQYLASSKSISQCLELSL